MEMLTVYDVVLVPLILGVVAVLTGIGMPKSAAPAVSVVIGVLLGVFYVAPGELAKGILIGAAIGLAAVGLYSGTKNTVQK